VALLRETLRAPAKPPVRNLPPPRLLFNVPPIVYHDHFLVQNDPKAGMLSLRVSSPALGWPLFSGESEFP
jgi:hypothetical protein